MEFICINSFLEVKEGDIFKKDTEKEDYYTNGEVSLHKDYMKDEKYFRKNEDKFKIEKVENIDKQKHLYRIEIEVNCTKDKLKKIGNFLNKNLNQILDE
jgi:hypothetical protein